MEDPNNKVVQRLDFKGGFTLLETLVAITVMLLAIVGPLTIATKGAQSTAAARDQIIAYFLAQEAVEYVRTARDTNVLAGAPSWLQGLEEMGGVNCNLSKGGSICSLDITNDATPVAECPGACTRLLFDDTAGALGGFYNYDSGQSTTFERFFWLSDVLGSSDEREIHVAVSWQTRLLPKTFVLRENIFNWQEVALNPPGLPPGPGPGTVIFADSFENATPNPVLLSDHIPEVGTGWSLLIDTGVALIASPSFDALRIFCNCTLASQGSFYTADVSYPTANYEVSVVYQNQDFTDDTVYLGCRVQDDKHGYFLRFSADVMDLVVQNGPSSGDTTVLGSASGASTGETVTLACNLDQISAQINGSDVIGPITDSTFTSANSAGVGMGNIDLPLYTGDDGSSQRVDDFQVTTF